MATSERIPPSARRGLTWLLGTGGAIVLVIVLARTAVGAIDVRLAPWAVAVLSAIGFSVSIGIWRLDDADRADDDWRRRLIGAAAAWLSGLLFGLLIAGPSAAGAASVAAVAITWAAAIGARLWRTCDLLRQWEVSATPATRAPDRSSGASLDSPATPPTPIPVADAPPSLLERAPDLPDEDLSLRMELRRRATPEAETIEITARLEFPAGAREAVLHVPFWPALRSPPEVECEPLESDNIDLRITAAESYGLRIEGRLPAAATAAHTVLIGIDVRAASANGGIAVAA